MFARRENDETSDRNAHLLNSELTSSVETPASPAKKIRSRLLAAKENSMEKRYARTFVASDLERSTNARLDKLFLHIDAARCQTPR